MIKDDDALQLLGVRGYVFLNYIGFGAIAILVEGERKRKASDIIRVTDRKLLRRENQYRSEHHDPIVYNHWPSFKHDNICCLLDYFFDRTRYYEILPHARLGSLEGFCTDPNRVLPEDLLRLFVTQITDGCLYLRNLNLSHGDLTLENMLVFDDGVRITEFGCMVWHSEQRETRYLLGKQLAPEILGMNFQYYNTEIADVFSLGTSILKLCGKCVNHQELQFNPNIPWNSMYGHEIEWRRMKKNVREMIHGMLARNPTDRYHLDDIVICPWVTCDETSRMKKKPRLLQRPTIDEAKNFDDEFYDELDDDRRSPR